ncbi:Glycoside hydrolase family 16 [Neofusicoccum parvum]|uniref:Glycoside hydrolase family 16 n=1 Tax=Neofusicoccum parvum TaxID=310453 RepID=A0ACB5SPC4_9PEZI|nr:Glycoside hydrolase family 16 [Neofusicoccum parvum]
MEDKIVEVTNITESPSNKPRKNKKGNNRTNHPNGKFSHHHIPHSAPIHTTNPFSPFSPFSPFFTYEQAQSRRDYFDAIAWPRDGDGDVVMVELATGGPVWFRGFWTNPLLEMELASGPMAGVEVDMGVWDGGCDCGCERADVSDGGFVADDEGDGRDVV